MLETKNKVSDSDYYKFVSSSIHLLVRYNDRELIIVRERENKDGWSLNWILASSKGKKKEKKEKREALHHAAAVQSPSHVISAP